MKNCAWLLPLATLASCTCGEPSSPPAARLPDVLLITLDTTRADRLGAYGYAEAHTPHLDALAASGRRYDQAWAPMPLTIPSHASLFTGLYPPHHGIRSNGDAVLAPDHLTLAERLQAAGYHTGASVAAFVTTRIWGFDQGFDAYFDEIPSGRDFWHSERPGAEVVDDLLRWREELPDDGPVFAWAHLFDAHHPYVPPEPFRSQAEGRPYDGEIAYLDHQVGRLLQAFDRPTVVVVVGDHGESLGQHDEWTHGLFLYGATQRVPYLVAGPGVAPQVVTEPVSLVDVAPTLLDLLGLHPLEGVDGRVAPGDPPRPVYLESWQLAQRFGLAPHLGLVDGEHLFIGTPRPELYDVVADPRQERDLSSALPERVAALSAHLQGLGFDPPATDPAHPVSPDVSAQLAALGYVDPTFAGALTDPLPDPKDREEMLKAVARLEVLGHARRGEEAATLLRQLVQDHPEIVEFHSRLAMLLYRLGRNDEARAVLERAVEQDPHNAMLKHAQAVLLARAGRHGEAATLFQEVADALPYAPRVRAMAVAALIEAGARDQGIALGRRYLQAFPGDPHVAGMVGMALVGRLQGQVGDKHDLQGLGEALELLERGIESSHPEKGVALHVASARLGAGRLDEARALLELELANHPGQAPAARALLKVLLRQGDWEALVQRCEAFFQNLERHSQRATQRGEALPPPPPQMLAEVRYLHAQALFNLTRFEEARAALDAGLQVAPEDPMLLLLDANLLKQEGHEERARARFEAAKAAKAREGQQALPAPD